MSRVRQRVWTVGFVVVLVVVGIIIGTAKAQATHSPYVSDPSYMGTRWPGLTVCVEDRSRLGYYVNQATSEINVKTVMVTYRRVGTGSCGTAAQKVIVTSGYWGRTGWNGRVLGFINRYWGRTAGGHWTWLTKGPLTVQLNLSYPNTVAGWDHLVTHELVHATLAIKDQVATCDSVIAHIGCPWKSYLTGWDVATGNRIMSQ